MSSFDVRRNEEILRAERVAKLEGALPDVLGTIAAEFRAQIDRDLDQLRRDVAKARREMTPEFVQSVYAEVLGKAAAAERAEWRRELEAIRNEARAVIAEFRASMLEAELARHDPAKLRAIAGGRGQ